MFMKVGLAFCALLVVSNAQQKGTNTPETTLDMPWEICKSGSGCSSQKGGVTMDGNWRWLHKVHNSTYLNIYELRST